MEEHTLTVSELGELLRAALSQVTPYGVWVEGEISGISRSRRGHVYFDLVEPAEITGSRPVATIPAVLWRDVRERVDRLLKQHGDPIRMTDGVQVRIRGTLDFYAPSGRVQLRMSAIDPTYTLGKLAAGRDLLLAKLSEEGILRTNAARPMPPVPLHVALVTSVGSAAHADMLEVLERSGLAFRVVEIDAAVQGRGSEIEVAAAIGAAADIGVDVIVVARGGGSRTDLAAFDHERMARAIAGSPIPVVTGIGHEIDSSVADEVAHTACATPTAAAQHVVDLVTGWLVLLDDMRTMIVGLGIAVLNRADGRLTATLDQLARSARHAVRDAERRVDSAHARTRAFDPTRTLARGWSITRRTDGTLVRAITDVVPGDELVTLVADGTLTSTISATGAAEEAS